MYNINKTTEAEFTIQNIYSPKFTYNPAENHDPDEDSDGFTITVSSRP
jgi:hypothetical protein